MRQVLPVPFCLRPFYAPHALDAYVVETSLLMDEPRKPRHVNFSIQNSVECQIVKLFRYLDEEELKHQILGPLFKESVPETITKLIMENLLEPLLKGPEWALSCLAYEVELQAIFEERAAEVLKLKDNKKAWSKKDIAKLKLAEKGQAKGTKKEATEQAAIPANTLEAVAILALAAFVSRSIITCSPIILDEKMFRQTYLGSQYDESREKSHALDQTFLLPRGDGDLRKKAPVVQDSTQDPIVL
ncbi:hypothetical protein ACFX2J_018486 [Malus domestica]